VERNIKSDSIRYSINISHYTTNTPGQLVFGRDTIFNVKHEANWEFIRKRKQQLIEKNNNAENAKENPSQL